MVKIGVSGTGDVKAPDPKQSISLSFTEFYLLALILIYETLCFLSIAIANLALSPIMIRSFYSLFKFNKTIEVSGLNFVALECFLAVCLLPLTTLLYEAVERFLFIRPAINRAKYNYPLLLPNVPDFSSIFLVVLAYWNITQSFHQRLDFYIKINKSPISCLKEIGAKLFGLLNENISVEEALNTSQFTLSILYLTYFLWKWALKRVPLMFVSNSASTMLRLKADLALGVVIFMLNGLLETYSKKGNIIEWLNLDLVNLVIVVGLTVGAEYFPWKDLFTFDEDCETSKEPGVNQVPEQNTRSAEDTPFAYWIHGLLFLLSTAPLSWIFFKLIIQNTVDKMDYYENDADGLGLGYPADYKQDNELLKELDGSIRWSIITFRAAFGYTLILIMRTLLDEKTSGAGRAYLQ